jgi:hypothetical protein
MVYFEFGRLVHNGYVHLIRLVCGYVFILIIEQHDFCLFDKKKKFLT